MGYYSDVALCVSEKVEIPEATRSIMESIGFDPVATCAGCRLWIVESIKWYDSYPEIDHLNRWRRSLKDEDYRLLMIGEDVHDYEEYGDFFDNPFGLGIERRFCYDVNP